MQATLINFFRIIYVSSLFLLTSCASTGTTSQQDREAWLLASDQVRFQARTVIKKQGSVYHFTLHWQQQGNDFKARGFDLLGRQLFQISGDQQTAVFQSKEQQQQNKSSREVISSQLGIDANPLELLHLLLAITNKDYQTIHKNNLPQQQQARSFTIYYNNYTRDNRFPLPSKVTVEADDIEVKMALYSWQLAQ